MELPMRDLSSVEAALLNEPSIYDCAVRVREGEGRGAHVVAYVAAGSGFMEDAVRTRLQHTSPVQPDSFVQLSALPMTAEGQIDERALSALPVIDEESLRHYQEQLLAMPEVAEAAVVTEEYVPESLPLHISDLLPSGVIPAAGGQVRTVIPEALPAAGPAAQGKRPAISHGGPLKNPEIPRVMGDALKRASAMPATHGITYVQPDGSEVYQSYAELLEDAERILAGLRAMGLKPQDPVIFQFDRNQDFIPAFWACMLGGFLAAPISIAPTYKEPNAAISKLHNCWELLNRPLVIAGEEISSQVRSIAGILGLRDIRVASIDHLRARERDRDWHTAKPDDVCLILFTSGSTGLPKGVQQCHRTLLSRSAATAERNQFDHHEVSLNWFPLDHVGGIVMFHLMDLFTCAHQVQVPTEVILQDPLKWLDLIDRFRATITWAPNFAFGLVNDHEAEVAARKWDLSSMRFILNGGEAIVAKTARRFLQILSPHGLRPDAMHPSWGMSETCSGVVFSERCRCDIIRDEDSFVEVGGPIAGVSLRIVDGKDEVVPEDQIGRLQIAGATVTVGYYKNPDLNRESFSADGWFNTGDLAFLSEGRLTITGRAKDVIIINGVNFYSHEVEAIVEEVEGVDVSYTAACAVRVAGSDTDRLAVFFSTPATDWPSTLDVIQRVREILLRTAGVFAEYVIPLPQAEVPKTAIGKIQRTKLRERFEAGEFADLLKQIDVRSASVNTVPDWFYRKVWRRRAGRPIDPELRKGKYLVFNDDRGLAEQVCAQLLHEGARCVRVVPGAAFEHSQPNTYKIRIDSIADYDRLITSVGPVDHVLHCLAYDSGSEGAAVDLESLRAAQYRYVYSLLLLIKTLARHLANTRVRLFTVTNGAQAVLPDDQLCPEKSPISGLLASAAMEMPWLGCRNVSVTGNSAAQDAQDVIGELAISASRPEVAYRDGLRWTMSVAKIDMLREPTCAVPIKRNGLYLITGGLGGLGTALAEYLMRQYEARLLLVGRTPLPDDGAAVLDGRVSKRIRNYGSLTRLAGEFVYRALDLSDTDALNSYVAEAESRWGQPLDGVFHLAGSLAGSVDLKAHFESIDEHSIARETIEAFETIFGAKLYGTWSLLQVLKSRPEALFVAFSSVNGVFGGNTLSAYSAANAALDALVRQHRRRHPKTYSMNWTMWDDLGMSENSPVYSRETSRSMGYQVIGKQQGINSMLAALCRTEPQLIVGLDAASPALRSYIDLDVYPRLRPLAYYVPRNEAAAEPLLPPFNQQLTSCRFVRLPQLPRNASGEIDKTRLATSTSPARKAATAVEPRSEMERRVARVWKEVLGVSGIGVTDTFFELGGDSLTAMRLVNRLRETFQIDVPVRALFEMPTIASLAAMLAENADVHTPQAASATVASTSDLLARVDHMSDEEVEALLNEMATNKGSE